MDEILEELKKIHKKSAEEINKKLNCEKEDN